MRDKPHIVHITTLHISQDIRIFYKECSSLEKAGYNISLIAPHPQDEVIDNINILAITRIKSRLPYFFWGSLQVCRKVISSNADICHFHDPELIFMAMFFALLGKGVVYDVHEDLPKQILSKSWIHPWLRYPVSWCAALTEWIGSRLFFSAIVAATPAIATRFPISKTTIIQNFPIKDELCTISSIEYDNKPQSMVYMGGITRIRGIEENIKAFGRIKHQNCRFLLAGSFSDENFKKESASLIGWSSVDYLGYLSREKVRHVLEKSRAGFVLFHPVPNHVDAQPNKLFEYMSAGVPIIASDFPLWRKIVRGSDCGLLVDPMKPEEIAKAIDWILDNPKKAEIMGENGRQAVADHYNWLHEEKVLLDLYGKLTT